jgi:hypothetical protein
MVPKSNLVSQTPIMNLMSPPPINFTEIASNVDGMHVDD